MGDVHTPEQRSRNMSAIRGVDTKPEVLLRKMLWKKGYRYRKNVKTIPGKPDLVLRKYSKALIFVHGCFWHRHSCNLFCWPKTDVEKWRTKIVGNVARDVKTVKELQEKGWRVLQVWACAIHGKHKLAEEDLLHRVEVFLESDERFMEISGLGLVV